MENTESTDSKIKPNYSTEPVHYLEADRGAEPEEGNALCLSGGGYRAMLFHAGVLWRRRKLDGFRK